MKPRIAFIRKAANQLLIECKIKEPPVDVIKIAAHCGVEYQEADDFDDVDSLIIPLEGRVIVAINKKLSPNRRRFSLAHEICHHLHHKDRAALEQMVTMDSPLDNDPDWSGKDPFEVEADKFAGELLVPLKMLKAHFKPGKHTAADVAEIFAVSQEVASIAITSHFAALYK